MKNTWKIHLDPSIATHLRNTVNQDLNISIRSQKTLKGPSSNRQFSSWNRICVTMDRIEDLASHINQMEIIQDSDSRTAFAFLDLLNHASVLLDCIYEIARLYNVDMSSCENAWDVFHMRGNDEKGTDKKYFEYLRSLCSIHPVQTDRHKRYQDSEFECCPYVCWNDGWQMSDCDLYAMIYLDKTEDDHCKKLPIHMSEVIHYVEKSYKSLDDVVVPGILAYQEAFRAHHRGVPIKTEKDFATYIDYLYYLGDEAEERLDCDRHYYTEEICRFFRTEFQNVRNKRLLCKYQNAIKLAISFHHNAIQNVSYDGYENNGMSFPRSGYGTTLLECVLSVDSNSTTAHKHGHALKTACELIEHYGTPYYAYGVLETARPFLEKYVDLSEAITDEKYYVLTRLALYADCLRNKNLLNQNIPNDLRYRFRRLSENSWEKLHQKQKPKKCGKNLEKLLREYMSAANVSFEDIIE